jgi:hypothetical protein
MLKSKAYNKKLTATYCTTSNTLFVHDAKIDAHKVYTAESVNIIRNLTSTQQSAFYMLPATFMQKAKNFNKLINTNVLKNLFTNS